MALRPGPGSLPCEPRDGLGSHVALHVAEALTGPSVRAISRLFDALYSNVGWDQVRLVRSDSLVPYFVVTTMARQPA